MRRRPLRRRAAASLPRSPRPSRPATSPRCGAVARAPDLSQRPEGFGPPVLRLDRSMELREALAMTTTTESQKLSSAMRQGLRAFYFHTTVSYTGGEHGDVERLNESGGTLHGTYRYW